MSCTKPWENLEKLENVIDQLINNHNENILMSRDWNMDPYIKSLKDELDGLEQRSKLTEAKVKRKEIKINFFGKISSGKSTVINALLWEDIFVYTQSHTTSCFVHITKPSRVEQKKYNIKYLKDGRNEEMQYESMDEAKNKIEELSTCYDLKNKNNLKINESVYFSMVCNEECKILKENIEIIDCPGSGNESEISNFIKEHSLDADIFIFVLKGSITEEDRVFFNYQAEHSNKPDVFILINACDDADDDNEKANKRSMDNIMDQCRKLIKKSCNRNINDNERIFCISAKEMLHKRAKKIQIDPKDEHYSKKMKRLCDFEQFEKILLDYIDHPERCKIERYHDEIENINKKIDKAFKQFNSQILSLRDDSILQKYNDGITGLNDLREQIRTNCDKKKKTLKDNLNRMNHLVDCYDLEKVNKAIEESHDNLDKEILTFGESQIQILNAFVNDIKLDINIDSALQTEVKRSWNDGMSLKTELIKEDHKKSTKHARWLSVIPIFGAIATNLALNKVDAVEQENKKRTENYFSDLKAELQNHNKDKLKILEENVEAILKKINKEIDKVQNVFEGKPILFNGYWENVGKILKTYM